MFRLLSNLPLDPEEATQPLVEWCVQKRWKAILMHIFLFQLAFFKKSSSSKFDIYADANPSIPSFPDKVSAPPRHATPGPSGHRTESPSSGSQSACVGRPLRDIPSSRLAPSTFPRPRLETLFPVTAPFPSSSVASGRHTHKHSGKGL